MGLLKGYEELLSCLDKVLRSATEAKTLAQNQLITTQGITSVHRNMGQVEDICLSLQAILQVERDLLKKEARSAAK